MLEINTSWTIQSKMISQFIILSFNTIIISPHIFFHMYKVLVLILTPFESAILNAKFKFLANKAVLPQNNLKQFGRWIFIEWLLSTGTILGTGDRAVNRLLSSSSLYQWSLVVMERNSKQISEQIISEVTNAVKKL